MIPMLRSSDCGPVASSNYLERVTGKPATLIYTDIMAHYGFPASDGIIADLWDSPTRHFKVMEKLTGKKPGLCDDSWNGACVVLLMLSPLAWHWVVQLGDGSFHDGMGITHKTFQERFPGCRVMLRYGLGHDGALPWYYSVWWYFTRLFTPGV